MSVAVQDVVHDVLFAESEAELTGVAGDQLADALASGAAVIVIATPEHRDLFLDRIRAAGVDPEGPTADGSLLLLDAAATLDQLRPAGAFDSAAFDQVVGSLVRERTARGSVFAFGEMVALLFDAGRPQEAIELEAAWDELLKETSARLLCAYPGELLDDPGHAAHVGSVCSLHSTVVAASGFHRSWTLADGRAATSTARRLVANALRARGVQEDAFYDTLSVVTELVGQAVAHGGVPISLEATIEDATVTVRVTDKNPAAPVAGAKLQRGLHLVQDLADRWGFAPSGPGKVVWAELAR